jgi:hypothetical protein
MTVCKIVGNTTTINSTPSYVPVSNTFGTNATAGATCVWIYNIQTSNTVLTLANSTGNVTFTIPPNTAIVLSKYAPDQLTASANLIANPIVRVPD